MVARGWWRADGGARMVARGWWRADDDAPVTMPVFRQRVFR
jgi:hypothetical protein